MVPEFTIITAVKDGATTIASCLASVRDQDVPVQHVIVDGDSRDGTLDIVHGWTGHPLEVSSGADGGISDAFNKGIVRARGSIVLILNADDRLVPGALRRSAEALRNDPGGAFAYGHCEHIYADGSRWLSRADPDYWRQLHRGMPRVNHPTMAVKRATYAKVGLYDQRWRLAMDFEWLLRANRMGCYGVMVNAVQAMMSMGGRSDVGWLAAYAEVRQIALQAGYPPLAVHAAYATAVAKRGARICLAAIGGDGIVRRLRGIMGQ